LAWLEDHSYLHLVKETKVTFNSSRLDSSHLQFLENLKRVKKDTISWNKEQTRTKIRLYRILKSNSISGLIKKWTFIKDKNFQILPQEKQKKTIILARVSQYKHKSIEKIKNFFHWC
jgi:hypothetical protein